MHKACAMCILVIERLTAEDNNWTLAFLNRKHMSYV